ncbi:hypothetical protein, partial [Pseudomonas sp. NPDC087626]|uniref:hypothetical protein n=1 Tax=Pseudomonas sp. NPDC087626 TaxID=3364444 RepID=UPI00381F99A3
MNASLDKCLSQGRTLAFCGSLVPPETGTVGCALSRGQKQNPYLHTQIGVSEFNLDDDLLSHGET